jgi:hypothetical protein
VNLKDVFAAVAHKELVVVDLPDAGSNQHEINGSGALQEFFGTKSATRGTLTWAYFHDDEEPTQEPGDFTFYDARAKSVTRTGRSEWRFYYYGNFLKRAKVGDLLVLARTKASGQLVGLVFQRDSAWVRAARSLFGIAVSHRQFDALTQDALGAKRLELLQRQILEELGLAIPLPSASTDEELMLKNFARSFPTTKKMGEFARAQVEVDLACADETLVRWLDREERLFRALENVIIGERLKLGFKTVDEFIEYSLSVQNRRKSRMGHALQNHLAEIFTKRGLRYTSQARTEGKNRPDFIFPGEREYRNSQFNETLLVMLGVKSSSKDRWRQVLDEADRVKKKHLCTLEPSISESQTDAMQHRHLTLVLPTQLHVTYTKKQRAKILSVDSFIEFVLSKQK